MIHIDVMTNRVKTPVLVNREYQQLQGDTTHSQTLDKPEADDEDGEHDIDEMFSNDRSESNVVQQHSEVLEHEHESGISGLHPIELTAHSILNAPLDHLYEDFELLGQSQYILLTRLRLIEDRLKSFKKVVIDDGNMTSEKEISETFNKIRELKKRLSVTVKSLDKVETRVEKMNKKLNIDANE